MACWNILEASSRKSLGIEEEGTLVAILSIGMLQLEWILEDCAVCRNQ